ncbi:MAG: hypothetical protein RR540_07760, partial [Oscillospiraceae bacterium]
SYKIVIIEEAKLDFKTALKWYKSIQPILGIKFTNSSKESLKIIKSNPLLFQIRYDETRVALIEKILDTNFSKNPFTMLFSDVSNIAYIGNLNAANRLEC